MEELTAARKVVRFGLFEVDLESQELRKSGIKIKIQDQPFQTLALLLERPGQIVTREEIQKRLWAGDTFVDFDLGLNSAIKKLRQALNDNSENPRFVETLYRRGYRFVFPVTTDAPKQKDETVTNLGVFARRWKFVVLVVGTVAIAIGALFSFVHKTRPLSETGTILITDFENRTGDAVFDDTLRQGLAVQLAQSPFLNVLSDRKTQDALKLMGRVGERLTPELARDLCQRTGSEVYLSGAITSLDSQFVVSLNAVNCQTGESLVQEQVRATSKDEVLRALDQGATKLRQRLGESLSSVQKFDAPLPEVTTSSLEALKAYALAKKAWAEKEDSGAATGLLLQAIELDPDFALSYASLGTIQRASGYPGLAREYTKKAFALRDHVSAREKLAISAAYYGGVTGELGAALSSCQLWEQLYPRDAEARRSAGYVYARLGKPEKALLKLQESVALDPDNTEGIAALMGAYAGVNRFVEAKAVYDKALKDHLDNGSMHLGRFYIAHLENDTAEMNRQLERSKIRPDEEDGFLYLQCVIEARRGRMKTAGEFCRRAMEVSERDGSTEEAAGAPGCLAVWHADFGEPGLGRQSASTALSLAQSREVQLRAALAFARIGDSSKAQALAEKLHEQYPSDTLLNLLWLPVIRAAIELNRHNPYAAIELLQPVTPYDLAADAFEELYVVYLRGEAFRLAHRGSEAAEEFQKIHDNRGLLAISTLDTLARLGLARAYALQGDTATARAKYQDFLTLWKDADPDIPILKQAKAEYAKLP